MVRIYNLLSAFILVGLLHPSMCSGVFAQDTQLNPQLNPLSLWDVIDFCDETTELMDAAIQTSAQSRDELIAVHSNTVYQFQDYQAYYQILGAEVGLLLAARGFIHHFEEYNIRPDHSDFPRCLARLSYENHRRLERALVLFLRAEARADELTSKQKIKRWEVFKLALEKTFKHQLPEASQIHSWVVTVRNNLTGVRFCDENLQRAQ